MKNKVEMSESFIITVFLTLSGGFQDAYTYLCRDEVFANAQTGNIVLLSGSLFTGNFKGAIRYAIPLIFFVFGVFAAELMRMVLKKMTLLHWRQVVLVLQIVILSVTAFMPSRLNILASSLVSFVCAMQVQTFRKVNGNPYASTMCIGNLRSATNCLYNFMFKGDKKELRRSLQYFGVILIFAVGAALGTVVTKSVGFYAILVSSFLLFIGFLIMFIKKSEG